MFIPASLYSPATRLCRLPTCLLLEIPISVGGGGEEEEDATETGGLLHSQHLFSVCSYHFYLLPFILGRKPLPPMLLSTVMVDKEMCCMWYSQMILERTGREILLLPEEEEEEGGGRGRRKMRGKYSLGRDGRGEEERGGGKALHHHHHLPLLT